MIVLAVKTIFTISNTTKSSLSDSTNQKKAFLRVSWPAMRTRLLQAMPYNYVDFLTLVAFQILL